MLCRHMCGSGLGIGERLSVPLPTAEIVQSGLREESNHEAGLERLSRAFGKALTGSATAIGL